MYGYSESGGNTVDEWGPNGSEAAPRSEGQPPPPVDNPDPVTFGEVVEEWGANSIMAPEPLPPPSMVLDGDPPAAQLFSGDPGNGQPHIPWLSVDVAGNLYVYGVLVSGGGGGSLPGVVTITPSGDVSGNTDVTAINNAITSLGGSGAGGTIWLGPGTYYIKASGITIPPYINLISPGNNQTILNCVGSGTGTYVLVANTSSPTSYTKLSNVISGMVIDGTSAGNGAIGLQFQDTNGVYMRAAVRNFTGTNSVGVQLANNNFSLNEMSGYGRIENCTQALVFNALGAQQALEHIYVEWSISSGSGQNPITLKNSAGVQGSKFTGAVGSDPNGGPIFTFNSGTVFSDCQFQFKAEQTGSGTSTTVSFVNSATGFQRCTGNLFFSTNIGNSNQVATNGLVKFFGYITGDSTLLDVPNGAPTNGATNTNAGPPFLLMLTGGNLVTVTINGTLAPPGTNSTNYIPCGGTWAVSWVTTAPTFTFATASAAS